MAGLAESPRTSLAGSRTPVVIIHKGTNIILLIAFLVLFSPIFQHLHIGKHIA